MTSAAAKTRPCPICRRPRSQEFAPFCSARCRDRDLANWFTDGYAVPGRPVAPDEIAPED
ncbi:MAG: DNA gyrase inhibitor YacG [Novosphingobium sp.]|nr:DNA gyrase inhibitor YacG [Novosphingobium sp.]MCB2089371.1 DNA gyrase inhibitor YacG [Sphingomonadaceae bacterium]MCP5379112.1 DNA gyrase inhibitor YacG [Novosphingobium sp.]MCP5388908.1 DNA gyrase inhibitor YacG [Novosphingobium sp.]